MTVETLPDVNWWIRNPVSVEEAEEAQSFCSGLVVAEPHPGDKTVRNKRYVETWYYGVLRRNEKLAKSWVGDYFSIQHPWPIYASRRWYNKHDPTGVAYWEMVARLSVQAAHVASSIRGGDVIRAAYLENHSPIWTWDVLDVVEIMRAMIRSGIAFDVGHPWSDYREFYTLACRFCSEEFWGIRYGPGWRPAKDGSRNTQIISVTDEHPNPHDRFTATQTAEYLGHARKRGENVTIFSNRDADNNGTHADVARQIKNKLPPVNEPDPHTDPIMDADQAEPMQLAGTDGKRPEFEPETRPVSAAAHAMAAHDE